MKLPSDGILRNDLSRRSILRNLSISSDDVKLDVEETGRKEGDGDGFTTPPCEEGIIIGRCWDRTIVIIFEGEIVEGEKGFRKFCRGGNS
jgi:hypothetical protein